MIDLEKEELITLGQATRLVPKRRGKKVHSSTLLSWIRRGYKGVFLDAVRQPGAWLTSVGSIQRFLVAVAKLDLPDTTQAERRQKEIEYGKSHERAMAKLRAKGLA